MIAGARRAVAVAVVVRALVDVDPSGGDRVDRRRPPGRPADRGMVGLDRRSRRRRPARRCPARRRTPTRRVIGPATRRGARRRVRRRRTPPTTPGRRSVIGPPPWRRQRDDVVDHGDAAAGTSSVVEPADVVERRRRSRRGPRRVRPPCRAARRIAGPSARLAGGVRRRRRRRRGPRPRARRRRRRASGSAASAANAAAEGEGVARRDGAVEHGEHARRPSRGVVDRHERAWSPARIRCARRRRGRSGDRWQAGRPPSPDRWRRRTRPAHAVTAARCRRSRSAPSPDAAT